MIPKLLPPGGARNALDCALWGLEAKLSRRRTWQIAGLEKVEALAHDVHPRRAMHRWSYLIQKDRDIGVDYKDGLISCPDTRWG